MITMGLIVLFAVVVAVLILGRFARAKTIPLMVRGLVFAVMGFGLAGLLGIWYLRLFGIIVGSCGVYFFFQGFKAEIISTIKREASDDNNQET